VTAARSQGIIGVESGRISDPSEAVELPQATWLPLPPSPSLFSPQVNRSEGYGVSTNQDNMSDELYQPIDIGSPFLQKSRQKEGSSPMAAVTPDDFR